MTDKTLIRIVAPHFVAGMMLRGIQIDRSAPIIYWMKKRGWSMWDVRAYCEKKGWDYEVS